jgi:hypothetical protein
MKKDRDYYKKKAGVFGSVTISNGDKISILNPLGYHIGRIIKKNDGNEDSDSLMMNVISEICLVNNSFKDCEYFNSLSFSDFKKLADITNDILNEINEPLHCEKNNNTNINQDNPNKEVLGEIAPRID